MFVLTPVFGALAVTAWAILNPALVVRHGLVVAQASTWEILVAGVLVGLVVLLVVMGAVLLGTIVYYRLWGDRVLETVYDGVHGSTMAWDLRYREGVRPGDLGSLGANLWIKLPTGKVLERLAEPFIYEHPRRAWAFMNEAWVGPGRYEARWYGARGGERWREIARTSVVLDENKQPVDARIRDELAHRGWEGQAIR
jgi:hypothetical protein